MTASRLRLACALLAAGAGCSSASLAARRSLPPPPASADRAGAPEAGGAGPAHATGRDPDAASRNREARVAVETASSLVGRRSLTVGGVDWGAGCTALVRVSMARAGHPLPPAVTDAAGLHAWAERRGALRAGRRLEPGDVVFLADRPGGAPAHAGLVARADPDGTAVVLHRVARGVARVRLNLAWPTRTNDPATGRLVNDTLYVGRQAVPAGNLVVGVADLFGRS
ncbi:MAG TPA: CHAP domain-containing protein [Anaeromyxobacteraceae bacterium]|nr:CHAP domain-containing protein [Anaeromyxobacteraceae bacterium]